MYPLTEFQIATLKALHHATNGSPNAHVPMQAIQRRFRKDARGFVPKTVRKLVSQQYAWRKKGGKQTSYGITKRGINTLKQKGLT